MLSLWGRRICWLATWRRHTPSLSVRWHIPVAYKERGHEAYALRLLGEIAAHRDPPDATLAEAHYQQARAELSTAIALYRTMEMTFWLPQAEAALAQVEAR